MYLFSSPKLTQKEKVLRKQIDSYVISEIQGREWLEIAGKCIQITSSLDMPDVVCEGPAASKFTFKRRLVLARGGNCYLLARWVPDRYMRRSADRSQQKWFVFKQVFPRDPERFFAQKRTTLEQQGRN
jgi:hypothetical protein